MKILYDNTGNIYYSVYSSDYFKFTHTTNIPLSIFDIDEVDPTNKAICLDLAKTYNKVDEVGDGKYIIISNILQEKEGWAEKQYDL